MRELFLAKLGATGYAALVKSFGADSSAAGRRLSGQTAALVGRVLDERSEE